MIDFKKSEMLLGVATFFWLLATIFITTGSIVIGVGIIGYAMGGLLFIVGCYFALTAFRQDKQERLYKHLQNNKKVKL
ncbi:MAG: hypothetical protein QM504_06585 [Pseudomonadota bacterium]